MPHYVQAIVYCFSGTGRTWRIAQQYAEELTHRGIHSTLTPLELGSVERTPRPDDEPPPLLVIAVPVHARQVPCEIGAWLDDLGPGQRRRVAVVLTCATNQGNAAERMSRQLTVRGYDVIHEALYVHGGKPWPGGRAGAWIVADIHEAVGEMLSGIRRRVGPAEGLDTPTPLVRVGYWLSRRQPNKTLAVADTCNLCLACLRLCPVGAISIARPQDAREGHALAVEITRACILCLRCAVVCPSKAITLTRSGLLQSVSPDILTEPGYVEALERAYNEPVS